MSKEIKFRAWLLEEDGVMVYPDNQASLNCCEVWVVDGDGVHVEIQDMQWKEGGGEVFEQTFYSKCAQEIMRYTGLKDKNGNEIYERDITRVWGGDNCDHKTDIIRIVKFDEYELGYEINTIGGDKCKLTKGNRHQLEVIGNIYENPELLKHHIKKCRIWD